MEKRLIKCHDCKHTFFTNKITFSNEEIKLKKNKLMSELKEFSDYGIDLLVQLQKIQDKIKANSIITKQINTDLDELNFKVQCSECGTRLHAVENEVIL
jgi:ribosomal protein S27E